MPRLAVGVEPLLHYSGFFAGLRPQGPTFVVRVVGIVREPTDISLVPSTQHVAYDSNGAVYLTPAFVRRFARGLGVPLDVLPGNEIVRVRFRHGRADRLGSRWPFRSM